MWIIPSNHPLYSAYARECVDSKEDLRELLVYRSEPQLMWRSKRLSLKIWYSKWSKVYWLPHLFGRTLKLSIQSRFVEEYTASLEVIHVSPSVWPASGEETMIPDTSGLTSNESSQQLSLFGASSKTSPDTLHSDIRKSEQTWNHLVTRLRKEYSQRRRLARLIEGSGYSFSQWPGITTSQGGSNHNSKTVKIGKFGMNLEGMVKIWATPKTQDCRHPSIHGDGSPGLAGTGTSLFVAEQLGRDWLGIELNPGSIAQIRERFIKKVGPIFTPQ